MQSTKLKPLPADINEIISALKQHITQCENYSSDFEHRHFNGVREKAVIYCLRHAIDLANGCIATTNAKLPDSLTTLSRAILEALFWVRYVTLSLENAQEFTNSTTNEMKRISRKNLKAGYAHIFDVNTNDDKTDEVLNSPLMGGIPQRMSIESAAKLGGLERIYTNIYGFISMIAHGRALNLRTKSNQDDELYASLCVALGVLECIEIITSDWIMYRKLTPRETLFRLLGA